MAIPSISINPNRIELDEAYLQMAEVWAKRSKANRLQVGAIIVKDKRIISDGYNGMPSGCEDDVCEYYDYDDYMVPETTMSTKSLVLHAESNALMKLAAAGGEGAKGATMYITDSPCPECAKLIKQAGIERVVYRREYRITTGIEMLRSLGVIVEHAEEK